MKMNNRLLGAGATAIMASLAFSGGASAKILKGTVVHENRHAHSFVVADSRGNLRAIHARKAPRIGRRVAIHARQLRNGTFSAQRVQAGKGRARRARLRGTVTYVNPVDHSFVLSARGVSLLIHAAKQARRAASAAALPGVGSDVSVVASLDGSDEFQAVSVQDQGQSQGAVELEGVILSIDVSARTLTLSADDENQSGATITVTLPDAFDISAYVVGDEMELEATLNADGTYTALGSSLDGNAQEAQSSADDQGEIGDGQCHSTDAPSGGDNNSSDPGNVQEDARASSDSQCGSTGPAQPDVRPSA